MRQLRTNFSLLLLAVLIGAQTLHAATFTWDGGGSGGNQYKWSKKQNWKNVDPVSAATSDFVFTGTLTPMVPIRNLPIRCSATH